MLAKEVVDLVYGKGIAKFTEIQQTAIPLVASGKHVLIVAPTGFGKTEAAALPVLSKTVLALKKAGENAAKSGAGGGGAGLAGIRALYITPLKALNRDMRERLAYWCGGLGISLDVRHGDTPASRRKKQQENPPLFLVTTPETLQSLLVNAHLGPALANVKHVIVDEVHELYENKRGAQLSVALERLRERAGEFQRIGVSATVGSEEEARVFLEKNAVVAKMDVARALDLRVESPQKGGSEENRLLGTGPDVSARLHRIAELLDAHARTLIFVNTRYAAEFLASSFYQLEQMKDKIGVHHSSLGRDVRLEVEGRLKSGEDAIRGVICTSSLELGIDVGQIDLVVQYGSPRQVARLLQRVGRSGHRHHLTPKGVVLGMDALDVAEAGVVAQLARAGKSEGKKVRRNALDVLAHQLVGIALDNGGSVELDRALALVRRSAAFDALAPQDALACAFQLARQGVAAFDGKTLRAGKRSLLYYYENVSMIADEKKMFVRDAETRRNVGVLDESFVAEYVQPGSVFISRGKPWRALSVTEDEVVVERAGDYTAAIPDWEGEEIPVEPLVARALPAFLQHPDETLLDADALDRARALWARQRKSFTPTPTEFAVEEGERMVVLHSFHGSRANEALARVLGALLTSRTGASVRTKATPYAIVFEGARELHAADVKRELDGLSPAKAVELLAGVLPNTPLFRHVFLQVAKRFGLLSKKAELGTLSLKRLVDAQSDSPVFTETLNELLNDRLDASALRNALEHARGTRVHDGKLSALGQAALEMGWSELLAPQEPTSELLAAFSRALLDKRTEFHCTYDAFAFSKKNDALPGKIKCPNCGSTQVTLAAYRDAFDAHKKKKKLDTAERKKLEDGLRVMEQIAAYGPRAVLAHATYGVGPENASRVLAKLQKNDDDFYRDLLDAQKSFIATRKFWKV